MKFTASSRRDSYSLSRSRRREGGGLSEPPPDTGQDKCKGSQDLFELLERVQSSRLDDQRCVLPPYFSSQVSSGITLPSLRSAVLQPVGASPLAARRSTTVPHPSQSCRGVDGECRESLEEVLRGPGPYPNVILPARGGYWLEAPSCPPALHPPPLDSATPYTTHFLGKEHVNLVGNDDTIGPMVMSVRQEGEGCRAVLRSKLGTFHQTLPTTQPPHLTAKMVLEECACGTWEPALCPQASRLIAAYDEHLLVTSFKFGVLYQRFGQTTEEQLFSNQHSSPALDEFLALLGHRINLRYHKGYRGGLDTQYGQTGEEAIYQVYKEREIIFHVSTLLPYTDNDPQQLQRKRHIGNDIVAIVFQECNTPFSPDMIASHFLHAFIVVQAIEPNTPNTRYKVSVTARDDVPQFGPSLPEPAVFSKGPRLREFLLNKLIAAESACYKAHKFAQLEVRTRCSLLGTLTSELREKTREFLGREEESSKGESGGGPGSRFIDTVRKALIARVRPEPQTKKPPEHDTVTRSLSKTSSTGKKSPPSSPISSPDMNTQHTPRVSESECSSLNSVELDGGGGYADSDTGLESMSSAETPSKPCVSCLDDEVTRLKCDKLDLLRQNVTCQREIKRLREKELALQSELASASKEILRLRDMLKELTSPEGSPV